MGNQGEKGKIALLVIKVKIKKKTRMKGKERLLKKTKKSKQK